MITIDTLGKMIEYGHWLSVHCNARDCWHRAPVDLPALAVCLGGDHQCLAPFLKPYFVCSKCGSRDVGFTTGAEMPNLFEGAYGGQPATVGDDPPAQKRHRRARKRGPRL